MNQRVRSFHDRIGLDEENIEFIREMVVLQAHNQR